MDHTPDRHGVACGFDAVVLGQECSLLARGFFVQQLFESSQPLFQFTGLLLLFFHFPVQSLDRGERRKTQRL